MLLVVLVGGWVGQECVCVSLNGWMDAWMDVCAVAWMGSMQGTPSSLISTI